MRYVEQIEPRLLLSGNVSVKFVGQQLRITGDDQDNAFTIAEPIGLSSNITSVVVIQGLNGTTIDGQPAFSKTVGLGLPFFYSSIKMSLGAGNDSVAVNGAMSGYNLSVDLGDGDDAFGGSQRSFGAVDIFGGDGRDRISLVGSFERRVRLFPGGGRDRTFFSGEAQRGFDLDDSGSGGVTRLDNITAGKSSTIALGRSADVLSINDSQFFELQVFAKAGNDSININNILCERQSSIFCGDGDDRFTPPRERLNLFIFD